MVCTSWTESLSWSASGGCRGAAPDSKARPKSNPTSTTKTLNLSKSLKLSMLRSFICKMKIIIPAFYLPHRDVVECKR